MKHKILYPLLLSLAVVAGYLSGSHSSFIAMADGPIEEEIMETQPTVYWIHRYIPMERSLYSIMPEDVVDLPEDEKVISMIAQTVYGEANGMSLYHRSLVVWCILNRVDNPRFANTIEEVITAPGQFHGYSTNKPVTKENYILARDVLIRWHAEKECIGDVGRTLPSKYLYFYGKHGKNWFRESWNGGEPYDFSLEDVYEKN